ncbi:MAG: 50S ribosome-binding GTPase, partial [Bacilli bacterium]|nr:50S ribosome-binding GTPase [Bacilli bacterium]
RQRLSDLNKTLKEIKKTNETKKTKRNKSFLKQVALVGYTNSGKSTTLNLFLEDEEKLVITKDMLFTTLDTYTRIVDINHHKILLSDTVGFISDLPKQLVDAFLSTIIEVKEADLIIQVVNGSNPNFEEEIENTNKILKQIGANQIKKIYLINKVDLVEHALIIPSKYENVIKFSAKTKENFNHLVDAIEDKLFSNEYFIKVEIPLEESKLINDLKKQGQVIKIVYNQTAVYLEVLVNKQLFDQIIKYKK